MSQARTYSGFLCQDERKLQRHEVVRPGPNASIPQIERDSRTLLLFLRLVGIGAPLAIVRVTTSAKHKARAI